MAFFGDIPCLTLKMITLGYLGLIGLTMIGIPIIGGIEKDTTITDHTMPVGPKSLSFNQSKSARILANV